LKKEYEGYKFEGGSEDTKESPIPGKFVEFISILPNGSRVINMFYGASVTEPVESSEEEITEIPTEDDNESSDEEEVEEQSRDGSKSGNVSLDGRCGEGIGRCKFGECCSKYGWCGKTVKHCNVELGCQMEFGKCTKSKGSMDSKDSMDSRDSKENEVIEIEKVPEENDNESTEEEEEEEEERKEEQKGVSSDGKCGEGIGRCKSGECCSKYGWCGKTEKYCKVELGCQMEFGKCTKSNNDYYKNGVRKDGKCGQGIGRCKTGECCSKYGWCGKTEKHCEVEFGCQSEYGECEKSSSKSGNEMISKDGKCGEGIGRCKSGECCSKYGWCGKSARYCSVREGCQSEYGECHHSRSHHSRITTTVTKVKTVMNTKIPDKCGRGYGSCKAGYCCSKYGWCGKSSSYCSKSRGCNSEYGICW